METFEAHAFPGETTGQPIGDRAGEHLHMQRGKYDAWLHVVFAFVMQVALLGAVLGGLAFAIVAGKHDAFAAYFGFGATLGIPITWLVFRDRFRCTEAFSSRFCSGLANLSVAYVPIIALLYANFRALRKLQGR